MGRLFAISLIILGVGGVVVLGMWTGDLHFHDSYFHRSDKAPEEVRPEMKVMEKFKSLKKAGDPAADQLLAPLPVAPAEPISQEEADRFQANCFLHRNIRIQSVRAVSANRFVLGTEGNWSAPPLQVRGPKRVDSIQRVLFNPDLIVEVRDGIIHGVR